MRSGRAAKDCLYTRSKWRPWPHEEELGSGQQGPTRTDDRSARGWPCSASEIAGSARVFATHKARWAEEPMAWFSEEGLSGSKGGSTLHRPPQTDVGKRAELRTVQKLPETEKWASHHHHRIRACQFLDWLCLAWLTGDVGPNKVGGRDFSEHAAMQALVECLAKC